MSKLILAMLRGLTLAASTSDFHIALLLACIVIIEKSLEKGSEHFVRLRVALAETTFFLPFTTVMSKMKDIYSLDNKQDITGKTVWKENKLEGTGITLLIAVHRSHVSRVKQGYIQLCSRYRKNCKKNYKNTKFGFHIATRKTCTTYQVGNMKHGRWS